MPRSRATSFTLKRLASPTNLVSWGDFSAVIVGTGGMIRHPGVPAGLLLCGAPKPTADEFLIRFSIAYAVKHVKRIRSSIDIAIMNHYSCGVSTDEKSLREFASILGRRGGLKGGKARAQRLSPERRKAIARKAAKARWARERAKRGNASPGS